MSDALDREFAYTTWETSCRALYGVNDGTPIFCRRRAGHEQQHAAGFGSARVTWEDA